MVGWNRTHTFCECLNTNVCMGERRLRGYLYDRYELGPICVITFFFSYIPHFSARLGLWVGRKAWSSNFKVMDFICGNIRLSMEFIYHTKDVKWVQFQPPPTRGILRGSGRTSIV